MSDGIKVSIIVPAYNAEEVVGKCVESILSQTLPDIEIIAVDDGSTDETRQILEKYAAKDSRIRLIKKDKNEGLSAARNSAIEIANGKYVGFVDADDWIEKDYIRTLYADGRDADLIVSGYRHDAMEENREKVNITRCVMMGPRYWSEKKKIVEEIAHIDSGKMFAYTWNKLYNLKLIKENKLLFPKQVLIEDFLFNVLFCDTIKSLSIVECVGYHYIKASKDALTQKFLPDFLDIMDKRFDAIRNLAEKNRVYQGTVRMEIANVYIKHAIAGVVRNCSSKANYSFSEQYKRCKRLLQDPRSRESRHFAHGKTKQEILCNFVYKLNNPFFLLMLGKIIYFLQTKSRTAFDRMK